MRTNCRFIARLAQMVPPPESKTTYWVGQRRTKLRKNAYIDLKEGRERVSSRRAGRIGPAVGDNHGNTRAGYPLRAEEH